MAMQRIFLGWSRPLCETVPDYLLSGFGAGLRDFRSTLVVVPTRQSSWRLRAALPLAADGCGATLLGPEIVTPPVLIEPPPAAAGATIFQSLLAWTLVLKAVQPGELAAFLGGREDRPAGTGWALQVARRLQDLRRELADGGFALADVAQGGEDLSEETERWTALAELELRYLRQLTRWKREDAISRKLAHARAGCLAPEVKRVVVAAVPDPPRLFMDLMSRWAAQGGAVDVLVAAPSSEQAAFDEWGRPRPEEWEKKGRYIPVRPDDIWLEATPDDQAARIRNAVQAARDANPAAVELRPQLAIGAPDRETVAPLQRELASIGLPAFDPQNRPFSETALFRLVQALLALRVRAGYAEVAAVLRHPDGLAAFGPGAPLLRALDEFQSARLPVTLDDMTGAPEPLGGAVARIRDWRDRLNAAAFPAGLRAVLQDIYRTRLLKSDDPADSAFQQAVAAFDSGLRELEGAVSAAQIGTEAAEVLLARLQDATVKAERRDEPLDLEGWLELAWNPAPLLFVAGMNEGLVPDGQVGDLFLPDRLRRRLGLRDDRLRVARDAYVLTALLEQRRAGGQVVLLVGKTSTAGDPLRPSRLLFRCPDEELVERARRLFQTPPPPYAPEAFTLSFKLDPARVPGAAIDSKRSREMSPTLFRDYLACPLRFYLKNVLGMQAADDRAREPDALAFGTLVHAVLNEMGRDRQLWGADDAVRLADWMEDRIKRRFREQFGVRPWLGVELALDSAIQRLRAFAARQVEWRAQGWEILSDECEAQKSVSLGGLVVRGRIDRLDRNTRTGAVCVLDYKTTDQAKAPPETHFGPVREADDLSEAGVLADWLAAPGSPPPKPKAGRAPAAKRDKRWADLQLPLYREFVRAQFDAARIHLGYICLPKALGETGFAIWEPYPDILHESAVKCAEAVARRIRAGVFWPPGKIKPGLQDDLEGLLLGDPEKSIQAPTAPWGGVP